MNPKVFNDWKKYAYEYEKHVSSHLIIKHSDIQTVQKKDVYEYEACF